MTNEEKMPGTNHENIQRPWVDGFTLVEKISMRIGFYLSLVIGLIAVFLESLSWGILYAVYTSIATLSILFFFLCAHCPYPRHFNDCLFMPAKILKKVFTFRSGRLGIGDKIAAVIGFSGIILIPQYWLIKRPVLLIIFWALTLPTLLRIYLFICPACRHIHCPFNRITKEK